MPRVKKAKHAIKKRRSTLSRAKGFRHGRKSKEKLAKEALLHAGRNAMRDRRRKKSDRRQVWNIKIGAITSQNGISYSRFISNLKKKGILLDRKVLAEIAKTEPDSLKKLIETVKE